MNTNREEVLSSVFTRFGSPVPIKIEPTPRKKTTVTSVTTSIHSQIESAINMLLSKENIQEVSRAECRQHRILRKKYGNIIVKIGYGNNNTTISKHFSERSFQSLYETIRFLKHFDELLLKGFFESEIVELVERLKKASEHAHAAKRRKKYE
jgi:hypothetical protein